jgi:hypothetical protein
VGKRTRFAGAIWPEYFCLPISGRNEKSGRINQMIKAADYAPVL